MSMVSFVWKGEPRTFAFFLPPNWWNTPRIQAGTGLPVIVALHGGGTNATEFIESSGFKRMLWLGDNNGASGLQPRSAPAHFIVIYPFAISLEGDLIGGDWNTRFHGARVLEWHEDDVGFIQECVLRVREHLDAQLAALYLAAVKSMDEANIFAFGFSAGGIMAHRLVAESPNTGSVWFKGIASCSCVMGGRRVNDLVALSALVNPGAGADRAWGPPATHNVHLLHVHGVADPEVPYDGGIAGSDQPYLQIGLSAPDSIAYATWYEPFENTLDLLWGVPLGTVVYTALAPVAGAIANSAFEDWYWDIGGPALATLGTWTFDNAGYGASGQVTEFFQSFVGAALGDYDVWLIKDQNLLHEIPQRSVTFNQLGNPLPATGTPGPPGPGVPWSVAEIAWQFFFDRL